MNRKLGFDAVQVLINAETVAELDEAIRVVNNSYSILRDHLMVFEELRLKVGFVDLDGKHKMD